MTGTTVAPVIPRPSGRAGAQRPGRPASRPLPLASALPGLPDTVVYGLGRIDASGRIRERAVVAAMGWASGDRLTLTADGGVVLARRDPGGMMVQPARPCLVIPAPLRRRCGMSPGDQVLLAALRRQDTVAIWPLTALHEVLVALAPVSPSLRSWP